MISDFYPGETQQYRVTITLSDGSGPNISGDAVTLTMRAGRDGNGAVVLTKALDVATSGADGIALLHLVSADTAALLPGWYAVDLVWHKAGGVDQHVLYSRSVRLLDRVSDPA